MRHVPEKVNETMLSQIKQGIMDCAKDDTMTAWQELERRDNKIWAIVVGWNDGFDKNIQDEYGHGDERLCMKLAYMPQNSMMSEYTMDWLYPEYPDSKEHELMDTEIGIFPDTDIEKSVNNLLKEYHDYRKELDRIEMETIKVEYEER